MTGYMSSHKSMKNGYVSILAAFVLIMAIGSCAPQPSMDKYSIIPKPSAMEVQRGEFVLDSGFQILADIENSEIQANCTYVSKKILEITGLSISVNSLTDNQDKNGTMSITLNENMPELGKEGYKLDISRQRISLESAHPAGIFYGIQSLLQLFPQKDNDREGNSLAVPCVKITDVPRFPYRGMHLDVGRHFFPKSFIKKYIDLLALHKFNTFHWHLTEDQGWRIEIKKYPKLTEIGSVRKESLVGHYREEPQRFDGTPYGGFYTQEDVKEIVAYAQSRYVTIIPEIEMPGHSLGALAAYPELSCTGGPHEVAVLWGVHEDVYCAGNDKVFTFLEDVLTEVIELFPGTYIHIGGDECPKARWEVCEKCQARIKAEGLKDEHELQSYFIRRIEKFLLAHDRKLIGWDEILEGGLAPEATVMSWRGMEGGIAAAQQGHDVIMTPTSHCYFDYYQGDKETEPLAIGGLLTLDKIYAFEPVPAELSPADAQHILGAQGNLWTEYIKTPEYAEYMSIPRMSALAEVVWSPKDARDWEDFQKRLAQFFQRLDAMGINYRKELF